MKIKNVSNTIAIHAMGTGALVLMALGFYVFAFLPYANASDRLLEANEQADHLESLEPKLRADHAELLVELEELSAVAIKAGPAGEHAMPLLNLVSELLQERGITLKNFSENKDYQFGNLIDVQLEGSYSDCARLIMDIQDLDRPAKIVHLDLTSISKDGDRCLAGASIVFPTKSSARQAAQE